MHSCAFSPGEFPSIKSNLRRTMKRAFSTPNFCNPRLSPRLYEE